MADVPEPVVLLIDDDPAWLRSLARVLRRRGARVFDFTTPGPVLDQLTEGTPDVIVLDYHLDHGWTGSKLARALRDYLRGSCPPLVLVSSTLGDVDEDDLAPFDEAFSKSASIDTLARSILRPTRAKRVSRSASVMRGAVLGELGRNGEEPGTGSSSG